MRKYVLFTVLAVAAAARNDGYWNVQDPEQLYGPLRVEPFEALGLLPPGEADVFATRDAH
jgi:hypothetical protein